MDNQQYSRRDFLKNLAIGAGGVALIGSFGFMFKFPKADGTLSSIVVDFDKCTGCRTCESVCSAYNHKVTVDSEQLNGLGNPYLSNIQVHHYLPDADVPVTCNMCPDTPCITACPVPPDLTTGRKALYRDDATLTIRNDRDRCLGCQECATACKTQRAGIIIPNPETHKPERMCRLCDGDPQCVKYCPYGALSVQEVNFEREFFGKSADEIATHLFNRYYS